MGALGHHLVLRLEDDRVIAPSRAARRKWARQFARLGDEFPILMWKLADTHLHILVLGELEVARELIRRLRIWVTRALAPGVPLEVQRTKPLAGQSHLEATFHYALRQGEHHGIEIDAPHEASALPDILGLRRVCHELPGRVREHLPRLKREHLLEHLQLDALDEELHPEWLLDAAKVGFCLDELGTDAHATRARGAALAAGRELGAPRLAELLGVSRECASRRLQEKAARKDVRAVALQMALHARRAAVIDPAEIVGISAKSITRL